MNSIRNYTRVSKFLNFHKIKQYKHVMRSYDFYNLSEFAFEHLRDSRRILAPVARSFFFFLKLFLATWSYLYLDLARALTPVVLTLVFVLFFFVFCFFWHNISVRGFYCASEVAQSAHGNKMSQTIAWRVLWDSATKPELRKAATDERQRKNWARPGRTSAWWDYFVNEVVLPEHFFHTGTIPGLTRFYHFQTF